MRQLTLLLTLSRGVEGDASHVFDSTVEMEGTRLVKLAEHQIQPVSVGLGLDERTEVSVQPPTALRSVLLWKSVFQPLVHHSGNDLAVPWSPCLRVHYGILFNGDTAFGNVAPD